MFQCIDFVSLFLIHILRQIESEFLGGWGGREAEYICLIRSPSDSNAVPAQ